MPEVGPVVPETTPAIHIPKYEIFNQVTIQIAHDKSACQSEQSAEVTSELFLARGNFDAKSDTVVAHVEEEES